MNKEKVIKVSNVGVGSGSHNKKSHLCFDCVNGCPSRCPKVADIKKKPIGEYEFITKGEETIGKNGEERFVVYECKNFVKVPHVSKKMTTKDKERIIELCDKLFMYYFDANTVEEAAKIQREAYQKGLLRVNEDQLYIVEEIKKEVKKLSEYEEMIAERERFNKALGVTEEDFAKYR